MLFKQAWKQVLADAKTEIRMPVKPGEVLVDDATRVTIGTRTKWKVGNTYAVQPGRGQKAVARIRLLGIEEGTLAQVGPDEVKAEGFASLSDFVADWENTHGGYDPGQPVWILRIEREPTAEEKAARERAQLEEQLWRMASAEFDKLSAIGHELGEWQQDGDLKLKNTCVRCQGEVTVWAGKLSLVGYIPLMHSEVCLADYPEQMEAAKQEWERRLADVYRILLAAGRRRRQREIESQLDQQT